GDGVARVGIPEPAIRDPVLDANHLPVEPSFEETAEDPTVSRGIAVVVGEALPHTDCRQVRWLQRGDMPLIRRIVGDTQEPDTSVTPRLDTRPFDAVVVVACLKLGEDIQQTSRAPRTTRVDAHAHITVRDPLL